MKRFPLIACLFVFFLSANMLFSADDCKILSEIGKIKRSITVRGSSEIKVVPDIITFSVGVENWNKNLKQAQSENTRITSQLLDIIKLYAIEDKYIQTNRLSLFPTYQNYKEEKVKGYKAENTIHIELRNIEIFDSLRSQLIDAGANNVYSVEYKTSEPRKYKNEARKEAVQAAKEKAEDMTAELGMKVLKAIEIIENQSDNSYYFNSSAYSNTIKSFDKKAENDVDENTTQVGQISIKANVTITFEIE